MPTTANKKLTPAAQLKEMCVLIGKLQNRLVRLEKNKATQRYEPMARDYLTFFMDLDRQQATNRYKWDGLPPELPDGRLIELMLYTRGSLAGFFQGGELRILPYAMKDGVNIYGMPNAVQPVTYNGKIIDGMDLPVNNYGGYDPNAKAVLLFDRTPNFNGSVPPIARMTLNIPLLEFQAEIMQRIGINVALSSVKGLVEVDNAKQADELMRDTWEALAAGNPLIVRKRSGNEKANSEQGKNKVVPFNDIPQQTQELFETLQSVNSLRCMGLGIDNQGVFEKKERAITGELEGDATQSNLVRDNGLYMRNLWLKQMREQYPEYAEKLNKITISVNDRNIDEREPYGDNNEKGASDDEYNNDV